MSIERVREYFRAFGRDKDIIEFEVSSATVSLASSALNTESGRIAKTLSFSLGDGKPILIVLSGDAYIDNHKYKERFKAKAKMLSSEDVERLIGHEVGGVCPFGINDGVDVYLDESLRSYDYVYPACGSSNSAIKLTIEELEEYSNSKGWVDVSKRAN